MIIERGIAMPPARGRKTQEAIAVARQMRVGDSVFFENILQNNHKDVQRLIYAGKTLNQKHTARQVEGGMRVWRIE